MKNKIKKLKTDKFKRNDVHPNYRCMHGNECKDILKCPSRFFFDPNNKTREKMIVTLLSFKDGSQGNMNTIVVSENPYIIENFIYNADNKLVAYSKINDMNLSEEDKALIKAIEI